MALQSEVFERGYVPFPEFSGERVYMHAFSRRNGLPAPLSRWQATVDAMLDGLDSQDRCYLMIDQREVQAGEPHRRPGLHVDGNWIESAQRHGGHGEHKHAGYSHASYHPEWVVLASNTGDCRALTGEYDGETGPGGECGHMDLSGLGEVVMIAARAYACTAATIHESLPLLRPAQRTLVRINAPQEPSNG